MNTECDKEKTYPTEPFLGKQLDWGCGNGMVSPEPASRNAKRSIDLYKLKEL